MSRTTSLRLSIAIPSIIVLVTLVITALLSPTSFVDSLKFVQSLILESFDWLFDWTVLAMLIVCIVVYISPLGAHKIGGHAAIPLMSKKKWYAIVLCTTIATGILFWGCAEPLYHIHEPAESSTEHSDLRVSSIATLFMHWSWSPYAIYTLISLLFALLFYDGGASFRVAAFIGAKREQSQRQHYLRYVYDLLDVICLIALVSGMAAALGAGILTISGGLSNITSLDEGMILWGLITGIIVIAFIISAIAGLHKGISRLSSFNTILFILFILVFAVLLMSTDVLLLAGSGVVEYIKCFVPSSLGTDGSNATWRHSWTTFYWANWMAWAPITALFLGRIGYGYTVRDFIKVNLIYTSLFAMLWVVIFGGVAILRDQTSGGALYQLLSEAGPQSVIFRLLEDAGLGLAGTVVLILIVFISYVTSADSNTSAMSALCTRTISPDQPEAPISIKVICGLTIGLVAWVMISFAGLDGIRILSVLGGFPALFLCVWVVIRMTLLVIRSK